MFMLWMIRICQEKCNWYCQYQLSAINTVLKRIHFLIANTHFKCWYRIYIKITWLMTLNELNMTKLWSTLVWKYFLKIEVNEIIILSERIWQALVFFLFTTFAHICSKFYIYLVYYIFWIAYTIIFRYI